MTYAKVARELDVGTLSKWVSQVESTEDAQWSDNPFQMAEDLRRLRREDEMLGRGIGYDITAPKANV